MDCKHLEGSNDASFHISCCNKTFPFETLTNKDFLSMMMLNSSPTNFKNNDADNINSNRFLALKPENLSLLFN